MPTAVKGRLGCLIIHGFGGNTNEVAPLTDYLSKKGFITVCPPLKGHTGIRRDMGKATYRDWIDLAEDALLKLQMECEHVVIIGFSMGGLIAVNLGVKYSPAALVTLNMPIYHWDFKRIAINLGKDLKSRSLTHFKHYVRAIFASPLISLFNFKILQSKTKPLVADLKCPLFAAQGLEDDTAHHRSGEYIQKNAGSEIKQVKYYKNSGHQICYDPDRDELFEDIADFITGLFKSVI